MAALCADYAGLVKINTFWRSTVVLVMALVRMFQLDFGIHRA
jgi:hypothetical protein